ncbi:hypothetical protein H8F24_02435 [Synechococcus sp. CBW1002]|uniref:hypothetical protein n=1 Tax=Synechococcus sp. CBW1002 TaxID=1353134 RepID=UPI0018CFEB1F|nr:hypothetical protein [Synechococcus sp. CBW1002]QPN60334.1 hypothetical protein H8F24_02435 [Synechococcus sp. CBW1002]
MQKQIIDKGGSINRSDLKALGIATAFALVLLISRALVTRSTDDELSQQRSQYFEAMLERYVISHRARTSTSSEIELDLERLDRVSNLLGRQAYLVRGQGLLEVCPNRSGGGAPPTVTCAGPALDPWPLSPPPTLLQQAI